MSQGALRALAEAAGISPSWQDFRGQWHDVADDTLRRVLQALGVAANTDAEIAQSLASMQQAQASAQTLRLFWVGERITAEGAFAIEWEGGDRTEALGELILDRPGYHTLVAGAARQPLAVAPPRCPAVSRNDAWGMAVQVYGLRRAGDGGIGDFPALAAFARAAAAEGASAVAISPLHAQFSADLSRFSPYAPSSRVMLNVLHVASDGDDALEHAEFVDWPLAARHRLASLRARFDAMPDRSALDAYRQEHGDVLQRHAVFEALHAHFFGADPAAWHWRSWPEAFRDPRSDAVARFAAERAEDVAFHAWLQMRAEAGLAEAQRAARDAGMAIGLIADLAVGTDGGGSHAWSRQDEMMIGLSIGAPPDLLNHQGQNWGIAAFSPLGLQRHGYAAFIEMLRAALRHAGGVRIDHVMGLHRLWVVPDGASAAEGAYLRFPLEDMLRLVTLEAHRHGAVVLGEDLGTVPEGFQPQLIARGLLGMRVLWFERDHDWLRPPAQWSPEAAAMTSTHDLATLAGWWRGRDLDWRERMGWDADPARYRGERERDRHLFWQAFRNSGAAEGDPPPPHDTWRFVDAALRHVARAACSLVMLPLEDVLALDEQPNLPATIDEHPNWRRRMPSTAEAMLAAPDVVARLSAFRQARQRG